MTIDVNWAKQQIATDPRTLDRMAACCSEADLKKVVAPGKAVQQIAKAYLKPPLHEVPVSTLLKRRVSDMGHAVWDLLDAMISACGFRTGDMTQAEEAQFGAPSRGERIILQLSMISAVIVLLTPLLTMTLAIYSVSAAVVGLGLLSLIYPYIRPPRHHLPFAQNWSLQYGRESFVRPPQNEATTKILNEMAERVLRSENILLPAEDRQRHIALCKAFARAVEQGKYPYLAGKQVIYFKAADFTAGVMPRNRIMAMIVQWMMKDKDRYIFLFDQLETWCVGDTPASKQFTRELDKDGALPSVIGMVMENGLQTLQHPDHKSFVGQFKQLDTTTLPAGLEEAERKENLAWALYTTAIKVARWGGCFASSHDRKKLLLLHAAVVE